MYNYVQNNKRMKYNKNFIGKTERVYFDTSMDKGISDYHSV